MTGVELVPFPGICQQADQCVQVFEVGLPLNVIVIAGVVCGRLCIGERPIQVKFFTPCNLTFEHTVSG